MADRNLEVCFPELHAAERASLVRRHFESLGLSFIEMGLAWFASDATLHRLIRVRGLDHRPGGGLVGGAQVGGRPTDAQRDAYKLCREWLDKAIELIKPGVSTDKVASVWPKAEEFGFPNELAAFGLQFGHGLGLALHERPIISRVVSLDHPMEIKEGMVFALETYCPAKDGYSAARIEEEIVVTNKGGVVISLFPAEELPISAKY